MEKHAASNARSILGHHSRGRAFSVPPRGAEAAPARELAGLTSAIGDPRSPQEERRQCPSRPPGKAVHR